MVAKVTEAVETKLIEDVKPPPPDTPPPPPPEMKTPPPPFIPPVEVQVQQTGPSNAITTGTTERPQAAELQRPAPPAPPAPPARPPVRTEAVADFNTCAKPEYPRSSQRNEETGISTISFLIGVDGRVIESKLTKSSGFRELDRAAQAALTKCRFKPAMVDGKPEQAWTAVQYVWSLD